MEKKDVTICRLRSTEKIFTFELVDLIERGILELHLMQIIIVIKRWEHNNIQRRNSKCILFGKE